MKRTVLFIFVLWGSLAMGQSPYRDTVVIVNPYKVTLSDAYKISDLPGKDTSSYKLQTLTYGINSKKVNPLFSASPINPVKVKDEKIRKLYKAFAELGYGTYSTPLARLHIGSLRSKEYSLGLHAKHFSSSGKINDAGFPGFRENMAGISGKRFFEKHTLAGDFTWSDTRYHFYGYDAVKNVFSKESIRHDFSGFSGGLNLASNFISKQRLNRSFGAKFHTLSDNYGATETGFVFDINGGKYVNKEYFGLDFRADISTLEDSVKSTGVFQNNVIDITPYVKTVIADSTGYGLQMRAGLHIAIESGPVEAFHFYPEVDVQLNLVENFLLAYGFFNGRVAKHTFREFTNENPFLHSVLTLQNTNEKINIGGGFKGTLSNSASFNIGLKYSTCDSFPFFVNDKWNAPGNKFEVIYDAVNILDVYGELGLIKTEKMRAILRGDYYKYYLSNELKPWHKPSVRVALSGTYHIGNKIHLKADLFAFGSRYAKTYWPIDAIKLNGYIDANIGVDYRYTKVLGFFLRFNNIAAARYYEWNNYPSRRFNLLGGISYAL